MASNNIIRPAPVPVIPRTDCPHCNDISLLSSEQWVVDNEDPVGHCPDCTNPPCSVCDDKTENWICLGCQQIFCSRFMNSHYQSHCERHPEHCLAVSLSDMSCWCNLCDSYVKHRQTMRARHCIYYSKFGNLPPDATPEDSPMVSRSTSAAVTPAPIAEDDEGELTDGPVPVSSATPAVALETEVESEKEVRPDTVSVNPALWDVPEGAAPLPIVVVYHNDCEFHSVRSIPEQPLRYVFTIKQLRDHYEPVTAASGPGGGRNIFVEAPLVTEEQATRFHTQEHWDGLMALCTEAENKYHTALASPKKKISDGAATLTVSVDMDTKVMHASRPAIQRAAGAVVHAVDLVCAAPRRATSVFCCVRPPGHHAERARAMGFCYLNNAAIGARHAQAMYGMQRVAVLDFDVHHGNGTEEGFAGDANTDTDDGSSSAAGTMVTAGSSSAGIGKMDTSGLFYGSTHEQDNFPGTGVEPAHKGEMAKDPMFRRIVNRYLPSGKASQAAFRVKWREVVEEMILFAPELIIFSAGFDAHKNDPLGGCSLLEEDFEWATRIVYEAAVTVCPTRPAPIISVLEGGYNMKALSDSALVHVRAMERGYPPPPAAGDEVAALQRHMDSLGLGRVDELHPPPPPETVSTSGTNNSSSISSSSSSSSAK